MIDQAQWNSFTSSVTNTLTAQTSDFKSLLSTSLLSPSGHRWHIRNLRELSKHMQNAEMYVFKYVNETCK